MRILLACASAATCCFLSSWVNLGESRVAYYARSSPLTVVAPVVCWQAILMAALLAAWIVLRRRGWSGRPAVARAAILLSLPPLAMLSLACVYLWPFRLNPLVRSVWFWPLAAILAVPLLAAALARPHRPARWLRSLFLLLTPVLALIVGRAFWRAAAYPRAAYLDGAPAPALASRPPRRVVWIVFDEMSQNLAFLHRPAGLTLPNLDRLRASAFSASAARSPGDMTESVMPALITGVPVLETEERGPRDLVVRTAAGESTWSAMPNVFDRARQLGANTALAGWFHPYARVLNRSLTRCYWTAPWLLPGTEEPFESESLAARMAGRLRLQLAAMPLAGRIPALAPLRYQGEYKRQAFRWLMARACELAADPVFGLVLFHLPVPHPPAISSRAPGRPGNYLDGLLTADQAWGELRRAMERSGVFERSAILISADHGWRWQLWRTQPGWTAEEEAAAGARDDMGVPFLLRLPGKQAALAYDRPFNTILSADLILEILRGQVLSADDAARWLTISSETRRPRSSSGRARPDPRR